MSEAIGDTEYNPQTEELTILFQDGSIYTYMTVPLMVFAALRVANSQGRFFNAEIRNVYPFYKGSSPHREDQQDSQAAIDAALGAALTTGAAVAGAGIGGLFTPKDKGK